MKLKSNDSISIISAILFLILGIVLISNPDIVVKFITWIIGGIIIILGITKLVSYLKYKKEFDDTNALILSITLIVIGIITIFLSSVVEFVVRLIMGGWLVYSGIIKLVLSLKLRKDNIQTWYIPLISSIVMLVCGLYTIIVQNMINMAGGVVLVIYSIAEIVQYITVPHTKDNEIIIKENHE